MFINCWNVENAESARMWAEYTTGPESIAISTTFASLIQALPVNELTISRVKYVDDETPRTEFSHTAPFLYKDKRFSFENELRLVRPVLDGEFVMLEDERDFGKLVPVHLGLIDRIVAHKNMPESALRQVRQLARHHCQGVEVLRSVVEPRILYI
jgi:hypothetical protein